MQTYTCLNPACNYSWIPRKFDRPVACPQCKARKWDDQKHWDRQRSRAEFRKEKAERQANKPETT